jgi:hypothetical protein
MQAFVINNNQNGKEKVSLKVLAGFLPFYKIIIFHLFAMSKLALLPFCCFVFLLFGAHFKNLL